MMDNYSAAGNPSVEERVSALKRAGYQPVSDHSYDLAGEVSHCKKSPAAVL